MNEQKKTVSNITVIHVDTIATTCSLSNHDQRYIYSLFSFLLIYEGQMIPTRNNDDEPDIIDLTTSYGYYGSFSFPIRPPSPFADTPIRPQIPSKHPSDNNTNGMVTWSSPFNHKTNNTGNSNHSSSHVTNTWRRTFSKFLKRTKLNKPKKVVTSSTSDITKPYDFGTGEITRTNSIILRSSNTNKRVHWIDDDEIILNTCHQFVQYLKLFVQNILDDENDNGEYLKNCRLSLDELQSLIDCQKIKEAFEVIIELAEEKDKKQLYEQQIYIENLISQTVLFSSA